MPNPQPSDLTGYRFRTEAKVRFAETDANGHMSHVTIAIYMEQARCELLTLLDLFRPQPAQNDGKTFVLASQSIQYHHQAYYNDEVLIFARVSRLGNSSIDIDYRIQNRETGVIISSGTSTNVCFDIRKQQSVPLPADLPGRIAEIESRYPEQTG